MTNLQTGHFMLISRNKLPIISLAFAVMDMVISGTSFAHSGAMEAIYVLRKKQIYFTRKTYVI
jgi:hypothetical protein